MSRIRYASEIFYPHIAKSSQKSIESAIRGMTRNIFNTTQSSPTKYMRAVTNLIPLGIKAMTQKIKIMMKMEKFYPKEMRQYETVFGKNI